MSKLEDSGQEKMEGDVFELREPSQRDKHLNIEVVQNGKTKEYIAKSGSFFGQGRTLADALHQLANGFDGAKIYGSENFDPDSLVGEKLRQCEYCSASIFFALTQNNKWMPLDGRSVEGKDLNGFRAFTILDLGGKPHVRFVSKPQGQVWIPHPEVCGANKEGPPAVPILQQRWEQNRKRTADLELEAVVDLQTIVHDLEILGDP
jgi:hypothetical protein